MLRCVEVLPGFYRIPAFPQYAISPEGRVIDRATQKEACRCMLSGYVHYTLKDSYGRKRLRGRCRLLMLAFKNPGLISGVLQVNHIDGNKRHDRLDNLEWVTPRENCEHAGATGLSAKCTPISVRDVDTGEVKRFPSVQACAREFGMPKDSILYRVHNGEHRVYPERKQYRKGHHDAAWIVYDDPELAGVTQFGNSRRLLVRFVKSGDVIEFETQADAAGHLNVSPAAVTTWLARPGQPVLPGFVQLKSAKDFSPWRQVNDAYLELAASTSTKPVKVTCVDTGDVRVFQSAIECAKECGVLSSTLNWRLKSNGKVVYSDRCRYEYYTVQNSLTVLSCSNAGIESSLIAGNPRRLTATAERESAAVTD